MKQICITVIFLFVGISQIVFSADFGTYIAFNSNAISYKSNYQYETLRLNPLGSYSLGCYYKSNAVKVFEFMGMFDYSMLRDKYDFLPITNNYGTGNPEIEGVNNHHMLNLTGLINYRIGKTLYVGTGLSASFLLASRTIVDAYKMVEESHNYYEFEKVDSKTYKNSFYSPLSLSVPVIIGFDIHKFDIFLKLNFGLTNRLKGETYVNEYNNVLQLGVMYSLRNL